MTELYSNKKSGNPPPHFYINHPFSGLSPLSGKKKYVPPKWGVGTPPCPFLKKGGRVPTMNYTLPKWLLCPPPFFKKRGGSNYELWAQNIPNKTASLFVSCGSTWQSKVKGINTAKITLQNCDWLNLILKLL